MAGGRGRRGEMPLADIPLPSYEYAGSDGDPLMEHTTSGPLPCNDPDGFDVRATDATRPLARAILDKIIEKLRENGCTIEIAGERRRSRTIRIFECTCAAWLMRIGRSRRLLPDRAALYGRGGI